MKNKKIFVLFFIILLAMILVTSAILFTLAIQMDIQKVKKETISVSAQETIERKDIGKYCNPVNAYTRVVCGKVTAIDEDNNIIELTGEDGEVWTTEVGYASEFDLNSYYCIFFDTMGTDTIYDDEIAKLWKEVW